VLTYASLICVWTNVAWRCVQGWVGRCRETQIGLRRHQSLARQRLVSSTLVSQLDTLQHWPLSCTGSISMTSRPLTPRHSFPPAFSSSRTYASQSLTQIRRIQRKSGLIPYEEHNGIVVVQVQSSSTFPLNSVLCLLCNCIKILQNRAANRWIFFSS